VPPERMAAALHVLTRGEKQGGSASGQLALLRLLLISHRQITPQAVPGSSQPPLGHSAAWVALAGHALQTVAQATAFHLGAARCEPALP